MVDEQGHQSGVEDPVGRRDPFGPGHVPGLVASASPGLRLQWQILVGSADYDEPCPGGKLGRVPSKHRDETVDGLAVDRQIVLFPATAHVQHDVRLKRRGEILAEQKVLLHISKELNR